MPFKKGQSGNPGGKPKELKGIQLLAREHAPQAIKTLVEIMRSRKAAPAARATAASMLLDRGYGKPPQFNTGDPMQFRKAVEMSDDELATIAGGSGEGAAEAPIDPAQLH